MVSFFTLRKSCRAVGLATALLLSVQAVSFGRSTVAHSRANAPGTRYIATTPAQIKKAPIDCWPTTSGRKIDDDNDGIVDRCEQTLAEKFAPVVYHSSAESNYPTNVDWFLQKTALRFYDDECDFLEGGDLDRLIQDKPTQTQLLLGAYTGGCGASDTVYSNGTRSYRKQRTFYLADVADNFKVGSIGDSRQWTTYVHAYRNSLGGVTIQYWRFYAADNGKDPVVGIFGGHGGDWEGIHVVLDDCLRPVQARLMGHTGIEEKNWSDMQKDSSGTHPLVFSEVGGHATHNNGDEIKANGCTITLPNGTTVPKILGCTIELGNPRTFIRQETWTGGNVQWNDGTTITPGGALLNVGEKVTPLNNQFFIQYSGIWGDPGDWYETSGYWNPAYNETEMGADFFIKAWCAGRAADVPNAECFPKAISR
jgi:hypothetical protein